MREKDPFYISKRNRRGILLLTAILVVLVFIPRIWVYLSSESDYTVEYVLTKREMALVADLSGMQKDRPLFAERSRKKQVYKKPDRRFDPNKLTAEGWQKLGLSDRQAAVVLRFTEHGVYSEAEFRKIFVIPDELYALIKDSLIFPERPVDNSHRSRKEEVETQHRSVEINSANAETLESLKGIGPFFARQIIKRREELGGFLYKEQLLEVWKMDAEKLSVFEQQITIDPQVVKKLNINTADITELKSHPYIDYSVANSIVKMRQQRGAYQSLDDLRESKLIDAELFRKLKPYLTL